MDIDKIRKDFPALQKEINGMPPIYFDNACMALKPIQVIEAMNSYYYEFPACGGMGRSSHYFGKEVDKAVYSAREKIMKFINARPCSDDAYLAHTPTQEIIFTRNATEAINLVANCFKFEKDSIVLTSGREHNSNLCPWKKLEQKGIIKHKAIPWKKDKVFEMEELEETLKKENVKLVSIAHVSNIDGSAAPAKDIIKLAHKYGAKVLLDGAQSVPHIPVDVQDLDVDFMAFSIHKMCGPSGMGALFGKEELLNSPDFGAFIVGGDTVEDTFLDEAPIYLESPFKFEAGLQNYSGMIGAGAAVDYLSNIGMKNIKNKVNHLWTFLREELAPYKDEFEILGEDNLENNNGIMTLFFKRKGVVNCLEENLRGIDNILNAKRNIMVRSGEYCAHSWFHENEIDRRSEKIRVSLYFYNTEEECRAFASSLGDIIKSWEYQALPFLNQKKII